MIYNKRKFFICLKEEYLNNDRSFLYNMVKLWDKNTEIEFRLDSELVSRQLEGFYKIENEKLAPLFLKIWNLKMDFGKIYFKHIPREQNREADRLANEAMDNESSKIRYQKSKLF